MNARFFVFSFLIMATTIGAGCARRPTNATPNATTSNEPLVWLPTSTPSTEKISTPLEELRAAIVAFQNTKSFKSKLYIDNTSGKTTGQIDVLKPGRFHGTLHLPSSDTDAEIIGVDTTLYVKSSDTAWVQISSPSMSKQLSDTFRSATNGSGALINETLPDGTVVTKKYDNLHSCEAYSTTLTPSGGQRADLVVCVAKGLPASLDIKTKDSHVSVEYTDYNSLFIIERPSVSKP